MELQINNYMKIRKASNNDADTITSFNIAMAKETEDLLLLPEVVSLGVSNLLENPNMGFYIVVEIEEAIVGSLMITTEWSDWRNGIFWWIQSVYVKPEYRRQGIYREMYMHVKSLAEKDSLVCGYRLYVENENVKAQKTYESLGMKRTHYSIFEELKS